VQPVSEIENPPFYVGCGYVQIVQIWLSPLLVIVYHLHHSVIKHNMEYGWTVRKIW